MKTVYNMSLKTVYLLAFLDAFNLALVLPVLNPHIASLGGSFMLCGILQSVGGGMQLFAGPIIGGLSDTYGRRFILLCTLSVIFIGDAIIAMDSLSMIFAGRILYGVAHHTDPLIKAIVTDVVTDKNEQASVFNKLIALPGTAFIIAPVLGGILHQQFGSLGIISGLLCAVDLLLIVIVYVYVPDLKTKTKHKPRQSGVWKKYLDLLAIKFVVEVAYNFLFMNTGLLFSKKYFFTRMQIGFAVGYMSITMMIGAILTPIVKKRLYTNDTVVSKRIQHALILMIASFTLLMLVQNGPQHLAIFLPAGLAKLMLESAWMEALNSRIQASEKGFMMGVATSMLSAAGLVCPLISGMVADYVGMNVLTALPFLPAVTALILSNKIQKMHVN